VKEGLIAAAVAVFLLFAGVNVYRLIYPPRRDVECVAKDSRGTVTATVRAHPANNRSLQRFMAEAKKRGETCKIVLPQ